MIDPSHIYFALPVLFLTIFLYIWHRSVQEIIPMMSRKDNIRIWLLALFLYMF